MTWWSWPICRNYKLSSPEKDSMSQIDFSQRIFKMFFAFWLDWIHYRNRLDFQVTVVMNISTENVSWFRSMLLDVFSQDGSEAVFFPSRFLPEGDNRLVSTDVMKSPSFHSIFFAISSRTFLYFKVWRFNNFSLLKNEKTLYDSKTEVSTEFYWGHMTPSRQRYRPPHLDKRTPCRFILPLD